MRNEGYEAAWIWPASRMGHWSVLKRLRLRAHSFLPVQNHKQFGEGFRSVRKLEVNVQNAKQLRRLLHVAMPQIDWLTLHEVPFGEAHAMMMLVAQHKSVRHLRILSDCEDDFGEALLPLADNARLHMLELGLGPETQLPHKLLRGCPLLQFFHTNCAMDDAGLKLLVDSHPDLLTLSIYGLDNTSLHGLIPSDGVSSAITSLSLVNCMGIDSEALSALAGVHPLRRLAIAFFDFEEAECNYTMNALIQFAAGCPQLEELQLGEFVCEDGYEWEQKCSNPITMDSGLKCLEALEQGCPSLRRLILPENSRIGSWYTDARRTSAEGLSRLNSLLEVKADEEVEWGAEASESLFASVEVLSFDVCHYRSQEPPTSRSRGLVV